MYCWAAREWLCVTAEVCIVDALLGEMPRLLKCQKLYCVICVRYFLLGRVGGVAD